MHELRTLLSLELRSLLGLNKWRHTKDKKEKRRGFLLLLAGIILAGTCVTYVGGYAFGLCSLGLGDIVPLYLTVLAGFLILAFGLFTAGERIFGRKGYDLFSSLPLATRHIVLSRFAAMYLSDLLLALAVMLPGITVYGICERPGVLFYPLALIGTLAIPAIPLVIATALGTVTLAISSRMKHKSLWQSALMVILVVAVLVGSFSLGMGAEDLTPDMLSNLAKTIGDLLGRIYPPALWLNAALLENDLLSLGLFLAVSVAAVALCVWIVTVCFHATVRRLGNHIAGGDYRLGALKRRSLLRTLYIREARRYFSSSIYVTNTIIGPILGAIMAIALAVTGPDTVMALLPVKIDLVGLLPFVLAGVFGMMTTTGTAISMEGKPIWVVKSLPIPPKALYDSKLLLSLSLMAPFYLIAAISLSISMAPDVWGILWLWLIPPSVMLFAAVFGLTVNIKFHSFDWEKEEAVVKQSLSAMLGGFGGFLVALVLGGAVYLIPASAGHLARALACLLLWGGTAILYRLNLRRGTVEL